MKSAIPLWLLSLTLSGCAHQMKVPKPPPISLPGLVGERVTLVGIAESWKVGPALRGTDFTVWLDDPKAWPSDHVGRKVQVVGILEERHDLPVFVGGYTRRTWSCPRDARSKRNRSR